MAHDIEFHAKSGAQASGATALPAGDGKAPEQRQTDEKKPVTNADLNKVYADFWAKQQSAA